MAASAPAVLGSCRSSSARGSAARLVHVVHELRQPGVTIARTLSDSFAGIKPGWAPMFIAMAVVGAGLAYGLICFLYPNDAAAGITAAGGSPR